MFTIAALVAFGLLGYTYVGYPALVAIAARLLPYRPRRDDAWRPKVSVLIPIADGAALLDAKLASVLGQDYAGELEVIFCSDGSTDGTDDALAAAAARDPRVRWVRNPVRSGKPTALNRMRPEARGEVLVLTDIRQALGPDAVRELVAWLADPEVGCVSGELVLAGGAGAGLYWRYESWIRASESRFRSMVGATGPLYALRRLDLPEVPTDVILDDMWIPMSLRLRGRRLLLAPAAVAEDAAFEDDREMIRKVRTLAGNYQLFARMPRLLLPFVNPSWFETMSHKVMRLVCPWVLVVLAATTVAALVREPGPVPALLAAGQAGFYAAAVLGKRIGGIGRLARTFVLMNVAAVQGLARWLRGQQKVTWELRPRG